MYVAADVAGQPQGYQRLRSADPTTFDWSTRERAGLAQYGNQIGYIKDLPGGPLFVRITFAGRERQVYALADKPHLIVTFGSKFPPFAGAVHLGAHTLSNRPVHYQEGTNVGDLGAELAAFVRGILDGMYRMPDAPTG